MEDGQVGSPVPLEAILSTDELRVRPPRKRDDEAILSALVSLSQTLANTPEKIFQTLVEKALSLCLAHSSGLSLLEEEKGRKIFRWHGVAGQYEQHLWGTTPREFSPCGTVLDKDAVLLMSNLDRHFEYFAKVEPRISEALLVPFHVDGHAVGTIWVISHDANRRFDTEDERALMMLGEFAAASYQALSGSVALRAILATIPCPLVVLEGSLRVRFASRSFYETFLVTPKVTEGHYFYELGNGQWNIPELRLLLEDILPQEKKVDDFELTHDFPGLGRRVMLLRGRQLVYEGNPAQLILLSIEDITARKDIEDELRRSNEDSQRFASVAAHDLRSPLRSSLALLEMLDRDAALEEDHRKLLFMARSGLERLQGMMSDILAFSLENPQNSTVFSLQEPLQMALTNLEGEVAGAQVNYGDLPSVRADKSQMTLVFQNLIGNALKFRRTDEPLRIQIESRRGDGECTVSVADNGQGFDPQYTEQVFLPFKRLHGPETPGSGLGLATCRRIVEGLGGRIWAEGTPGAGATFYFTLPDEITAAEVHEHTNSRTGH